MGGSHDRRIFRRAVERQVANRSMPDIPTSAQGPQLAVESKNVWQRLLGFIEQPLFLTPVGIVAGIVGVFIYIPVLCICGGCVLLAFHRAKVVTGCPVIKVLVPSYLLLFVVTFATLSSAQVYVSRKMKDANISIPAIVNQIISGVVSGISKFAPQSNLASPGTAAPSTPSAPPQIIRAYIDVRLYDKGYPVTPYWLVVPDLTGGFCTSESEREFTLEGSWYANEEIQAGADRDTAAAG